MPENPEQSGLLRIRSINEVLVIAQIGGYRKAYPFLGTSGSFSLDAVVLGSPARDSDVSVKASEATSGKEGASF